MVVLGIACMNYKLPLVVVVRQLHVNPFLAFVMRLFDVYRRFILTSVLGFCVVPSATMAFLWCSSPGRPKILWTPSSAFVLCMFNRAAVALCHMAFLWLLQRPEEFPTRPYGVHDLFHGALGRSRGEVRTSCWCDVGITWCPIDAGIFSNEALKDFAGSTKTIC